MSQNKKIACITLDIEDDLGCRNLRMFEDDSLMDRYAQIIQDNDVKVTAFLVTSLFERYAQKINTLNQSLPIEFELHSHTHDLKNPCSREEIKQAYHAYQTFFGYAPQGYRAPIGQINQAGLHHLLEFGLKYDASIYPSIRPGKYGHWNVEFPIEPFKFVHGSDSIVEFPFASLQTCRLVFSLSYIKLFGLKMYRILMKRFRLPDVVVLLSHPYDFYVHLIADHIDGPEKYAHLRNARQAFNLFEQTIKMLHQQGYEFMYMSQLYHHVANDELPEIPSAKVRHKTRSTPV